jgi:hypothetical protein
VSASNGAAHCISIPIQQHPLIVSMGAHCISIPIQHHCISIPIQQHINVASKLSTLVLSAWVHMQHATSARTCNVSKNRTLISVVPASTYGALLAAHPPTINIRRTANLPTLPSSTRVRPDCWSQPTSNTCRTPELGWQTKAALHSCLSNRGRKFAHTCRVCAMHG